MEVLESFYDAIKDDLTNKEAEVTEMVPKHLQEEHKALSKFDFIFCFAFLGIIRDFPLWRHFRQEIIFYSKRLNLFS